MRRSLWLIGTVGATACASVLGLLVAVHVTHPRDEAGYMHYLVTYGGVFEAAGGTVPAKAALIAEGDRACNWLDGQTWALWRTDPPLRVTAVEARYGDELRHVPLPWSSQPDHWTIGAAAWQYLCPAALELREPHDIFGATAHD